MGRQHKSTTGRKSSTRRARLSKRLKTYSAMAAAVTAGGAATQSADAVIIASPPLNISLFNNFPGGFGVDFNGTDNDNSGDDIMIFHDPSAFFITTTSMLGVQAAPSNSVVGYISGGGFAYASRLAFSSPIGQSPAASMINPNLGNVQSAATMAYAGGLGQWNAATNTGTLSGFLGAKFQIGSDTHFGWIAVTVNNSDLSGTITRYAYESEPDKPIGAGHLSPPSPGPIPEPTHLGLLALGAAGVAAFRRRKSRA
jgi:hypothetical protein